MTDFVKAVNVVVSVILYKLKMSIGMPQNCSSVPKCVTHDVFFFFLCSCLASPAKFVPGQNNQGVCFPLGQGGVATCTVDRLIGDVPAARRDARLH